jgi:uncharacterized FAD-dependent dehydrogenase
MKKETEITLLPYNIDNNDLIKKLVVKQLRISPEDLNGIRIIKRSIDARKKPVYRVRLMAFINETPTEDFTKFEFKDVSKSRRAIIVGSGPAGLFAALQLLELGIKPAIFERGKDVRKRRFSLRDIMLKGIVDEDSNYCFGEGGAGTYSDGKLYTRSLKRGNVKRILDLLILHGAEKNISIDSHPHIGSNKLPQIIENMRNTILQHGGEFHFDSRVTDLIIKGNMIKGVVVNDEAEFEAEAVILATGHSAADVWEIIEKNDLRLENKPFAVGVRIEHPQALIDSIQYKVKTRPLTLPAASYSLVNNAKGRGVYSFCMCPGGIIVPASTKSDELVLNGMSVSKRNSPFANSGIVVSVDKFDWKKFSSFKHFAGLKFRETIEEKAFQAGGGKQIAPAQRVTDFVAGKISNSLPNSSYKPGIVPFDLNAIFPAAISNSLKSSLIEFGKKMRGYYTEEAIILAPETRTSSPVKVPRDAKDRMHPECNGLFPAGEGAGYAGGIVSAAIDGENSAKAVKEYFSVI